MHCRHWGPCHMTELQRQSCHCSGSGEGGTDREACSAHCCAVLQRRRNAPDALVAKVIVLPLPSVPHVRPLSKRRHTLNSTLVRHGTPFSSTVANARAPGAPTPQDCPYVSAPHMLVAVEWPIIAYKEAQGRETCVGSQGSRKALGTLVANGAVQADHLRLIRKEACACLVQWHAEASPPLPWLCCSDKFGHWHAAVTILLQ